MAETDLVVARRAIDSLQDHIYLLECAIEDVTQDLVDDNRPEAVRKALDWLLEAARPLVAKRLLTEPEAAGPAVAAGQAEPEGAEPAELSSAST